jgi:Tfp pilus assembly protein PilE
MAVKDPVLGADTRSVFSRLRHEEKGFGLLELLISIVILNIGILAIVAAFNSGAISLLRAGQVSTASALADQQLELYRAVHYTDIYLDTTSESTAQTDTVYNCDKAMGATCGANTQVTQAFALLTGESGSPPPRCNARRTLLGPDKHRYRVDTFIRLDYPTTSATSRQVKVVTVVVRDGNKLTRTLSRESSTFDQMTGL